MSDLVDRILSDPSVWAFSPTEEETRRVRDAYVGYQMSSQTVPDFDALRLCIVGGFGGDTKAILKFWDDALLADAPDRSTVDPGLRGQIENLWRKRKIASIVAGLGLEPLVEWEKISTSACLKSPDQLRSAGNVLERANEEGFSLTSYDLDEEAAVVTWHLHRKRGA